MKNFNELDYDLLNVVRNEMRHLVCFGEDLVFGKRCKIDWYVRLAKSGIADCKKRIKEVYRIQEKRNSGEGCKEVSNK